jgi:hypothetical protein
MRKHRSTVQYLFTPSHDVNLKVHRNLCPGVLTEYHIAAMPGPFKSLVVVAAIEGLILHPPGQRNQRNLQIKYKTQEILPAGCSALPGSPASAEVHGIVGIRPLSSSSGHLADDSNLPRTSHPRSRLLPDCHSPP